MEDLNIFSGQANEPLARKIVACIPATTLKPVYFRKFADGDLKVRLGESVRGQEIYIIQPTNPPAENLIELLMMIDAAKRAGVHRINIVIPYMGSMRQDAKEHPREPITARLIGDLIKATAGIVPHDIIAVDLHAKQQEGYYDSITHLYARPIAVEFFQKRFQREIAAKTLVIGAPDLNASKQAQAFAERLGNCPLVVVQKRRPQENVSEVMRVLEEQGGVNGRTVLFIDDMIDTFGTIDNATKAVCERGAAAVYAFGTHGPLSPPALARIRSSPIKRVFITDTILQKSQRLGHAGRSKIEVISIAPLLAKAIVRTHNHQSVSSLFE